MEYNLITHDIYMLYIFNGLICLFNFDKKSNKSYKLVFNNEYYGY